MPDDLTNARILLLAPGFLSWRLHKTVRGVQVFDLRLVRQLGDLGIHITVPAERSWKPQFDDHLRGAHFEPVYVPNLRKPVFDTLAASHALRGRSFDAAIIGNPARGLLPGLARMHRAGLFDRATLIAHRTVRDAFASKLPKSLDLNAIAVNTEIAAQASDVLGIPVDTYYGIANAELFFPAETPRDDPRLRLIVVGQLENDWKGADTAIDAYRALPDEVRAGVELHLASYPDGRSFPDEGIHAYPWMPVERVAELLRTMDVMLVPSRENETFSQVIVQGMLTGLPIIASDLPVLAEKLDTGGGVTCSTVKCYTKAIADLAQNRERRRDMGAIARHTAQQRYIWNTEHFARTWLLQTPAGSAGASRSS